MVRAHKPTSAEAGHQTRERIVEAALATLKQDGFAGASARTIARNGAFNPALIFYHFGSVTDLLLAALDETSRRRLDGYRELLADVRTLPELMAVAAEQFREDLRSGHITVVAEMIAGASSVPELGPEIVARVKPWLEMTEQALARVLAGTPFEGLAPASDLAYLVVAQYLGLEMLTHLEGDPSRAGFVFKLAADVAALFGGTP